MARTDYRSVDDYLAAQPEASRAILDEVRAAIRAALPDAQEAISYQIPTYRVAGRVALYFAGWKSHFSIYPASARVVETFRAELEPYTVAKGTIRFPLASPVPAKLIAAIARVKGEEAMERARVPRR